MAVDTGFEIHESETLNTPRASRRQTQTSTPLSNEEVSGVSPTPDDAPAELEIFGLTDTDVLLSGTTGDNEYLEEFYTRAVEVVKSSKLNIKVFKMDKDKFMIGHSYIVYALQADNGKIYYFAALLEITGREPLTVEQVLEDMDQKDGTALYVTADGFDRTVIEKVKYLLSKAFGDVPTASLEGMVVPNNTPVLVAADIVTKQAHDLFYVAYMKDTGKGRDITLNILTKDSRNSYLNVDLSFNDGITVNKLGRPVHTDFFIESSIVKNTVMRGINDVEGRKRIALATGYMDYLIRSKTHAYSGVSTKIAEPMIILNEFVGKVPTLNHVLTSIINSAVFTSYANLRNLIIEKNGGVLNFLFNYGGDPKQLGERIDFKDPKAKPDMVADIIQEHFTDMPLFAVEIEFYGPDFAYTSAFTTLGHPNYGAMANDEILTATEDLLGFAIDEMEVAADEGLTIPIGYFEYADGERHDFREITTTFIADKTNDQQLIYDWARSNLSDSQCLDTRGILPYTLRLEVIDKLARILKVKPVVTGKARRIVLNGAFMDTLIRGASRSNYTPRIEAPNMSNNNHTNLQAISNAYSAGRVTAHNFGTTHTTGSARNMPQYRSFRY